MSTSPSKSAGSRAAAAGGFLKRIARSWGALEGEQRTAAVAALALFATMFLPWYTRSAVGVVKGQPVKVDDTLTAFGSFSFVEAAVLLVAIGVLWMLFARGEGKAFHLPFGDGNVIFAAGLWVCALVFYRNFDKPSPDTAQGLATNVGVSWGIFVTFLVGMFLAFSGQRLRVAHVAEPPLPGAVTPSDAPRARPAYHEDHDPRPRPEGDARPTVVDRRAAPVDETLVTDVPEFPPRRTGGSTAVRPPSDEDRPPTARTRVSRPSDEQLRLDDEAPTGPDGQLRFDS